MVKKIYELNVKSGEDLKQAVTDYIQKNQWEEVFIMGGIGSVIDVAVTNPVENRLPLKTASIPVSGAAELLSLTGEVMKRELMDPELEAVYPDKTNPLFVHIHVSVGTSGGHVCGGGLERGKAFRSVRIFMTPLD